LAAGCVLFDENPRTWETVVAQRPVIGGLACFQSQFLNAVEYFVVAIGSNAARAEVFYKVAVMGVVPTAVIHRSAIVSRRSEVGEGSVICGRAIVESGAVVGRNCIVNTVSLIGRDSVIGANSHISPGAGIGAGAVIGDSVHVGTGAKIVPGVHIGSGCVIGAGAVVLRDVAAGSRVIGVPARPIVRLSR
jgi:UDP-perosamine 4-acetyltransferase